MPAPLDKYTALSAICSNCSGCCELKGKDAIPPLMVNLMHWSRKLVAVCRESPRALSMMLTLNDNECAVHRVNWVEGVLVKHGSWSIDSKEKDC